jgi:hypothetical protein
MIDRRQHGEEREPKAQAPDDQLLLDRQQRLEGAVRRPSRMEPLVGSTKGLGTVCIYF